MGSECTVPLHAGLHVDVDRGAAHSCGKFFVPAVGQLHRTALGLQGEGHSNGLALGLILAAEATADLRDRKAHLLHGHMKGLGDQPPVAEGGLSGHPDVDLPRDGIRLRGGSMGFNGGVLQHPAGEVALHDLVRLGEASLHISLFRWYWSPMLVPCTGKQALEQSYWLQSSWTSTSFFIEVSRSLTTGNCSYSTWISLAASRAISWVSAATAATGSPW